MSLASRILTVAHDAPQSLVRVLAGLGSLERQSQGATPAVVPMTVAAIKKLPAEEAVVAVTYLPASSLEEVFAKDKRKSVRTALLDHPQLDDALAVRILDWACGTEGISGVYDLRQAVRGAVERLSVDAILTLPNRAWWQVSDTLAARVVEALDDADALEAALTTLPPQGRRAVLVAGLVDPGSLTRGEYLTRIGEDLHVLHELRALPVELVRDLAEEPELFARLLGTRQLGMRLRKECWSWAVAEVTEHGPLWRQALRLLETTRQHLAEVNAGLDLAQLEELSVTELLALGFDGASHLEVRVRRVLGAIAEVRADEAFSAMVAVVIEHGSVTLVQEVLTTVVTHNPDAGDDVAKRIVIMARRNRPELLEDEALRTQLLSLELAAFTRLSLLGPGDGAAFAAIIAELEESDRRAIADRGLDDILRAVNTVALDEPEALVALFKLLPREPYWLGQWSTEGANPKDATHIRAWLGQAPVNQIPTLLEALGDWDATGGVLDARVVAEEEVARRVTEISGLDLPEALCVEVCVTHVNLARRYIHERQAPDVLRALRLAVAAHPRRPSAQLVTVLLESYTMVPPQTAAEWEAFDHAWQEALASIDSGAAVIRLVLEELELDEERLHRALVAGQEAHTSARPGLLQPEWVHGRYTANPYRPELFQRLIAEGQVHENHDRLAVALMGTAEGRETLAQSTTLVRAAQDRGAPATLVRAVYELLAERLGDDEMAWTQAMSLAEGWTGSLDELAKVALVTTA